MIKANELRIGNKIFDPFDNIVEVAEILKDSISLSNRNGGTFASFSPISLSRKVLLTCGFTYDYNWLRYNIDNYKTYYVLNVFNNRYVVSENIPHQLKHDIQQVKYLHQLQNLYFALTNTELTVQGSVANEAK